MVFTGADLAEWLIKSGTIQNKEEVSEIANQMMDDLCFAEIHRNTHKFVNSSSMCFIFAEDSRSHGHVAADCESWH
jgi:hypothetical protein